jgi:hypothetical protein
MSQSQDGNKKNVLKLKIKNAMRFSLVVYQAYF